MSVLVSTCQYLFPMPLLSTVHDHLLHCKTIPLEIASHFPPSLNMSFLQAEERCKKQLEDSMKPTTRMGVGKPVYNVGQLVRFMLLHLVLSSDFCSFLRFFSVFRFYLNESKYIHAK